MLALALLSLAGPPAPPPIAPLLVTTGWVAEHLKDPKLLFFQIGDRTSKAVYDAGHLPGAQFLDPFNDLALHHAESGLVLELPPAARLDSVLEAKGVSDDSRIVLYTASEYFSPLGRAFFTLEYAGLKGRVVVMDGGLETWKAEGRPLSTDVPAPAAGRFTVRPDPGMVVDASWLKTRLEDPSVAVIDARDPKFFNGADTRQARSGRIPGAKNLPFNTVIDETGKFKDPAALTRLLEEAGVAESKTVVTYCHIGQQASLVWFVARLMGYQAKLYDGSFQDWAGRAELPVDPGK
jgi:thiosulfate/3-mercaptopyruvate sulfurtransferase